MNSFEEAQNKIVTDFLGISNHLQTYLEGDDVNCSVFIDYLYTKFFLGESSTINIKCFLRLTQSFLFKFPSCEERLMYLLNTILIKSGNQNLSDPISDKELEEKIISIISLNILNQLNLLIKKELLTNPRTFGIRPNIVFLNFYSTLLRNQVYGIENHLEIERMLKIAQPIAPSSQIHFENITDRFGSIKDQIEDQIGQVYIEKNSDFQQKDETIENYIEKDDSFSLQKYCTSVSDSFLVTQPFKEPFKHLYQKFVQIDNYLALAAFFGSAECFNYLLSFHFTEITYKSNENIFRSAVIGGNTEIISTLLDNGFNSNGTGHIAAILERWDLLKWLEEKATNIYSVDQKELKKFFKFLVLLNIQFLQPILNYGPNESKEMNNDQIISKLHYFTHFFIQYEHISIVLQYCIKYDNLPMFSLFFGQINGEIKNRFINEETVSCFYKSRFFEFCIFCRSFDIINFVIRYPGFLFDDQRASEVYSHNTYFEIFNDLIKFLRNQPTTTNFNKFGLIFIDDKILSCSMIKVPIREKMLILNCTNHEINIESFIKKEAFSCNEDIISPSFGIIIKAVQIKYFLV